MGVNAADLDLKSPRKDLGTWMDLYRPQMRQIATKFGAANGTAGPANELSPEAGAVPSLTGQQYLSAHRAHILSKTLLAGLDIISKNGTQTFVI